MDAREFMEKNFPRLTFGRALRADRLAEEKTQTMLAELVGLSTMAISRFESGRDFPTAETTQRLAKALRMDAETYYVLIIRDMAEKKGFTGVNVTLEKSKKSKKKKSA